MIKDPNFLCEIGTEEIPAGYLPPAIKAIEKFLRDKLSENRLDYSEVEVLATPRRTALFVSSLSDMQRSEEVELKGPSVKAAYDNDGNPTKALEGFLKGNKITQNDIFHKEIEKKGEYIFANKKEEAKPAVEIIPGIIELVIKTITYPKSMRWSDKELLYPRPITYFCILFNDEPVDFSIEGIESAPKTRGHYIQHNHFVDVPSIAQYETILEDNGVILDHNRRKEIIKKDLSAAAEQTGGSLYEDEELLDIVTFLVEKPEVVICQFNDEFLSVPDIALVAEMKEHQKYFPVLNSDGSLMNYFLVVSNNPGTDFVKEGNARVITARFNDARFFYSEDKKMKLADRVDELKSILFHKELGSIYDKVERMRFVAGAVVKKIGLDGEVASDIDRAILLSKTDLTTSMVYEFTSLQGYMGKIYALEDGEKETVAAAIEEHYRPRFHGDAPPSNPVSYVTSLAEKIDNIFGSFSVGNIPKGSQDPYALRRQSHAVLEILIENGINIDLKGLFEDISGQYRDGDSLVDKLIEFIEGRAKTIFQDRGLVFDEIDACLSVENYDYLEILRRAESIHEFRKNSDFSDMLLGLKRMNNILTGFKKKNPGHAFAFKSSLMEEEAEKGLYSFFSEKADTIRSYIDESNYIELFKLLTGGKSVIDKFFDEVLVMDKREDVRDNRLAMLEEILSDFTSLMDFSRLSDS